MVEAICLAWMYMMYWHLSEWGFPASKEWQQCVSRFQPSLPCMCSVHIQQYHSFVWLPKDEVVIFYLNMSASPFRQEGKYHHSLSSVFRAPIHQ